MSGKGKNHLEAFLQYFQKLEEEKQPPEILAFLDEARQTLHQIFHPLIANYQAIGNSFYHQCNYHKAISSYSHGLLILQNKYYRLRPKEKKWYSIYDSIFNSVCSILINNRAQCYLKLKQYEKSLRDLNWIIRATYTVYDVSVSFQQFMVSHCTKALIRRANILFILGNSALSMRSYMSSSAEPHNDYSNMKKIHSLIKSRHPSTFSLPKCDKYTRKLNIFSKSGWIRLKPMNNSDILPFKHGHSMIVHNNKIYCFGGIHVQYGQDGNLTQYEHFKNILFFKIIIKQNKLTNNYFYQWKQLQFPHEFIYLLNQQLNSWSRLVTINKWKSSMILFGGNDPFINVLQFNFSTQTWNKFKIKKLKFKVPDLISNHTSVIVNDRLYIYGGSYNANTMYCLNLLTGKWKKLDGIDKINRNFKDKISQNRYDHLMWKDTNYGEFGSLYVAFGSFYAHDGWMHKEIPRQRKDFWRYDIKQNKWYRQLLHGNYPVYRAESGFVSVYDNDIIIFGGYNSSLISVTNNSNDNQPVINSQIYFGDCFKYNNQQQKWLMIHSNVIPPHRALPAMCQLNNFIVLYGGYQDVDEENVYNDLWILDMNKIKSKQTNYVLKLCGICRKTENEVRLYVCSKCRNQRYCSKLCQKTDWKLKHKNICVQKLI
eukprot:281581_1